METAKLGEITRWGKVQAWWLRHPGIDADHFSVLAALSTYADAEGYCEPSQATLARWLKRSRPWVNRVIADLVESGLLEKTARRRANGGTTSCRYRLSSQPTVSPATPTVIGGDTPCHTDDRNQFVTKQIQKPAHRARTHAADDDHYHGEEIPELLPVDWLPSEAAVERALALYPSVNLAEHTALFVARCRGKAYMVKPSGANDLWLAWLIEDNRAFSRVASAGGALKSESASQRSRHGEARFSRFTAWALAATMPLSPRPEL